MGVPSIFGRKMESKSSEAMQLNPASIVAVGTPTSSAIRDDAKTQFYLSINNMSKLHLTDAVNQMEVDSNKGGLSFVAKVPGASKQEKIYLNPKIYDQVHGGTWGKLSDTSTGNGMMIGDCIFSGGHNPIMTVIGLTNRKNVPLTNIPTDTISQVTTATPTSSAFVGPPKPAEVSGPQMPSSNMKKYYEDLAKTNEALAKGWGVTKKLDPSTGKVVNSKENISINANGGNASVGTTLKPPVTIAETVKNAMIQKFIDPTISSYRKTTSAPTNWINSILRN